jgi:hypothetical protein
VVATVVRASPLASSASDAFLTGVVVVAELVCEGVRQPFRGLAAQGQTGQTQVVAVGVAGRW